MDHPLLNAFWMIFWFFIWIMWFMLLFRVLADVFRDHSISGWAKTGWIIFVCVIPFIGIFVYLIVRGKGMAARDQKQVQDADKALKDYVRDAAATPGDTSADQLSKLAKLRDDGTLTDAEFQQAKAKILA
jgi:hypothetical protein